MSRKRVTLAQVAETAGLSLTTVSLVLNDRPGTRIATETAARVKKVAAELGYSPDPAAKVLRTGISGSVGFISDEVTVTRFASAMIRGALEVGEESGKIVIMAEVDRSFSRMEAAVATMLERRVDGLLIGLMHARLIDVPALPSDLPTVIVNGAASGVAGVLPAEYSAGQAAANYLLDRGHRRIALIGRWPQPGDLRASATISLRMKGIDDALGQRGLAPAYEVAGAVWEPELGYQAMREVAERASVTAVIAANDRVAFGVYQAAAELGLSIPGALSVISFDDEQLAAYLRPPITTLRLPYQQMGRIGMEMVVAGVPAPETTLAPMPLVERASVSRLSGPVRYSG